MKRLSYCFTWIFLTFLMAIAVNAQVGSPDQSKIRGEITSTLSVLADAQKEKDVKRLAQIFSDDIVVIDDSGFVLTKTDQLEMMKPVPNVKVTSVLHESVDIKVINEVGIVTGLNRTEYVSDKKRLSLSRFTAVFVKRDGRWQIVSFHENRLPKAVVDAAQ